MGGMNATGLSLCPMILYFVNDLTVINTLSSASNELVVHPCPAQNAQYEREEGKKKKKEKEEKHERDGNKTSAIENRTIRRNASHL